MPDAKDWISRIKRVEPPDVWNEATAHARRNVSSADRGHHRRHETPRPRLGALIIGLVVGGLALAVVLIAFPSEPAGPIGISPAPRGSVTPSSTASSSPEPSALEDLTMTVDLDEPPVTWTEIAFLPSGAAEEQIGDTPCFHCEPVVPSALAVDRDGSFWIPDVGKARIAHFARDGSFIEAFPADIGSALSEPEHAADIAFVRDRLYVLMEEGGAKVVPVEGGGLGEPIIVNDGDRKLHVEALIPGQDELLVLISGAERLLGGYWAYATVDPGTGQVTPSPGVPDEVGTRVNIQPDFDERATVEIQWFHEGQGLVAVQEVHFQLVHNGKERITSVGDMYVRTPTQRGVATVMSLGSAQGTPAGMWYLEVVPENPSIVLERLPGEGFIGDARRSLTVGPDGEVYWMRLLDDGLHVYQR